MPATSIVLMQQQPDLELVLGGDVNNPSLCFAGGKATAPSGYVCVSGAWVAIDSGGNLLPLRVSNCRPTLAGDVTKPQQWVMSAYTETPGTLQWWVIFVSSALVNVEAKA